MGKSGLGLPSPRARFTSVAGLARSGRRSEKETPRKHRFRGDGNQSSSLELIDPSIASWDCWLALGGGDLM